jgi:hypothetical protein
VRRCEIESLRSDRPYWVLSVVSPCRDWAAIPGCRKGARFLVDADTISASRDTFATFDTELGCLEWLMAHRRLVNQTLPGAAVRPVLLDRWLLGLA